MSVAAPPTVASIDAQIAGLWEQHRAYVMGKSFDVNAVHNLQLIDLLLDQRFELTKS